MENSGIRVAFIKSSKPENVDKVEPSEIQLSNKRFMKDVQFHENYENWLEKDIFPLDVILVKLASLSYDDHPSERINEICPGWTVLTTAYNPIDRYFGVAYFNRETQQLVVGHRGTQFSVNQAVLTDIEGIVLNRHTSQINSACTFAAFLLSQFEARPVQISFTGHSLGAWLAQITTFSTEYLIIDQSSNSFRVKAEDEDDHHAHAVTFDSPGCKRMLSKISENYFPGYSQPDYEKWTNLDITNYLTLPNYINICNGHVGNLLQLTIKPPNMLNNCGLLYTMHYHSITNIVEAMEARKEVTNGGIISLIGGLLFTLSFWFLGKSNKSKHELGAVKVIHSWPTLDLPEKMLRDDQPSSPPSTTFSSYARTIKSFPWLIRTVFHVDKLDYQTFFKENYSRTENIKIGDDNLHFHVVDFDGKTGNISVFCEREKAFLDRWLALDVFVSRKRADLLKNLRNRKLISEENVVTRAEFQLENKVIRCRRENEVGETINWVKQLFRLLPSAEVKKMTQDLAEESKFDLTICKRLSAENVEKNIFQNGFTFKDNIGLGNFLNGDDERILLLKIERPSNLHVARIFSSLTGDFREKRVLLNYADLQRLSKFIILKKTFNRLSDYLIILDCQILECNNTFFTELLSSFVDVRTKLILVINAHLPLNSNLDFVVKAMVKKSDITFLSLSDESQNLLRQKCIRLQGRDIQLSELLDKANFDTLSLPIIETLTNNEEINIGGNIRKICDFQQFTFKFDKIIDQTCVIKFLQKFSDVDRFRIIIFLTNPSENDAKINFLKEVSTCSNDLVTCVEGNNSEEFTRLCYENVKSRVYWLEIISSERMTLRQIYAGDLCREQKFSEFSEIPKRVIKERLAEENLSDCFVFHAPNLADVKKYFNFKKNSYINKNRIRFVNSSQESINIPISESVYEVMNQFPNDELLRVDEDFLTVKHEINFGEKFVILADEPGMGKSVKLVEICAKMAELGWVIYVNLFENQNKILKLNKTDENGNITLDAIIQLLHSNFETSIYPEFEKVLLFNRLNNENSEPVFLLFDGFNEIEKAAQDNFIAVLEVLKRQKMVRIWVTTRTDYKNTLENSFFGFSKSLKKFSEDEQREYLIKCWKILLNFEEIEEENKLISYENEVLDEAKAVLESREKYNIILGNPLHIRLFAEVMYKLVEESIFCNAAKLHINQHHNMQSLFRGFISVRFDHYFHQNIQSNATLFLNAVKSESFKAFQKLHGYLALRLLFPTSFLKFFQHRNLGSELFSDEKITAFAQVGLTKLDVCGNYQFTYQVFSEYFMANLLLNCLDKYNAQHPMYHVVKDSLMKGIFLKKKYSFIRKLINERPEN